MSPSTKLRMMTAPNAALGAACGLVVDHLDPIPGLMNGLFGVYSPPTTVDYLEAYFVWLPIAPALLILIQGVFLRLPRPFIWYPLLGILCCAGQPLTLIALWWGEGVSPAWSDSGRVGWSAAGGAVAGAIAAILSARVAPRMSRVRRRRKMEHVCANCGYCLIGNVSGICPECGTPRAGPQRSASTSRSPRFPSND